MTPLAFFLILPLLLKQGVGFPLAVALAILATAGIYAAAVWAARIL